VEPLWPVLFASPERARVTPSGDIRERDIVSSQRSIREFAQHLRRPRRAAVRLAIGGDDERIDLHDAVASLLARRRN
jgi:hypothetical protein